MKNLNTTMNHESLGLLIVAQGEGFAGTLVDQDQNRTEFRADTLIELFARLDGHCAKDGRADQDRVDLSSLAQHLQDTLTESTVYVDSRGNWHASAHFNAYFSSGDGVTVHALGDDPTDALSKLDAYIRNED